MDRPPLERFGGSVRTKDPGGLRRVREALTGFLFSGKKARKRIKCEICTGGKTTPFELGVEDLRVFLQILHIPPVEKKKFKERRTSLMLCKDCTATLPGLIGTVHRLEDYRCGFNHLRRRLGTQIIKFALHRTKGELAEWDEEVKRMEHVFPSCVQQRKREEVGGSQDEEEGGSEVEEEEEEDGEAAEEEEGGSEVEEEGGALEEEEPIKKDAKLNKMTPVVLLERLKEPPDVKTELTTSCWSEEEFNVKSETTVTETQNGAQENDNALNFWESALATTEESEECEEKKPELPVETLPQPPKRRHFDPNDNELEDPSYIPGCSSSPGEYSVAKRQRCEKCKKCGEKFTTKSGLQSHIKKVHESLNFKCSGCESAFNEKADLDKHLQSYYPFTSLYHKKKKKPRVFPCPHCHFKLTALIHLRAHKMKFHPLDSPNPPLPQCRFCLKFFSTKPSLLSHQATVHFGGRSPPPTGSEEGQSPQNIHCFLCKTLKGPLTPEELKAHEESPEHLQKVHSKTHAFCVGTRRPANPPEEL